MADLRYFNGFNEKLTNASDYYICGQRLIEVWTSYKDFKNTGERKEYFKESSQSHVLSVELDMVKDEPKVIFFYDDKPAKFEPVDTIPTTDELIAMLESLNG